MTAKLQLGHLLHLKEWCLRIRLILALCLCESQGKERKGERADVLSFRDEKKSHSCNESREALNLSFRVLIFLNTKCVSCGGKKAKESRSVAAPDPCDPLCKLAFLIYAVPAARLQSSYSLFLETG